MSRAGSSELFLPETFALIQQSTGGIPRLINIVCDTALVYGFADQATSIDAQIIRTVLNDRAGILPLAVPAETAVPALAG